MPWLLPIVTIMSSSLPIISPIVFALYLQDFSRLKKQFLWVAAKNIPYALMPDGFKMDLPLGKAEHMSNSGSASVIKYLCYYSNCSHREVWKYVRGRTLQTPRLVKSGGTCSRCWNRDSPAAGGEDYSEAGCPGVNEIHDTVNATYSLWRTPC